MIGGEIYKKELKGSVSSSKYGKLLTSARVPMKTPYKVITKVENLYVIKINAKMSTSSISYELIKLYTY